MADQRNSPPIRSLPPAVTTQPRQQAPGNQNRVAPKKRANYSSLPFWFGVLMSVTWIVGVIIAIAQAGPARTFGGMSLVDWAIGISAIASPVALIWMVSAYLQRAA